MKVLQINTVVSYGSTGRICRDISDILTNYDHESVIAYGRGAHIDNYATIKIGSQMDVYFHFAKSFLLDRHGFGSVKATKQFVRNIEKIEPDIIHLHNIHGYYLNIKILFDYLKDAKIPIIWTLHDTWIISGGPASFIVNHRKNYEASSYPATWRRYNFQKNLNQKKQLISALDNLIIVSPSNWLSEICRRTFLNQFEIKTIHNGVDKEKFYPMKSEIRSKYNIENKKIILAVSNVWNNTKGLSYIIELAGVISKDTVIVMIGVNEQISKLLPDCIIAIKRTNNVEELVQWYSSADLFLNPTLEDNFPTVNIESLSCGTPVITYDTGGSGEAVGNSLTGKVIEYNNSNALNEAVMTWPKKNEEIIEAALMRSQKFDKKSNYNKYIELYHYVLQGS